MTPQAFEGSAEFWERAGVPVLPILADLDWISRKHPKEFKTEADVAAHVAFVLSGSGLVTFEGTAKGARGFARVEDRRCAVVQLVPRVSPAGARVYWVLTAYTLTPGQMARALGEAPAPGVGPGSSVTHAGGAGLQGRPSVPASQGKDKHTPTRKRSNPAMDFGSKEWNEHHGLGKGHTHGSGAHAAKRKAAKARGASALTKKGADKLAEALGEDSGFREGLKAHQAEGRALDRILGPTGRTHAVKIAKEHGTFDREDVAEFLRLGWRVLPAATVPAKLGATLGPLEPWAVALNPTAPDFGRVLGPKGEARALVLALPQASIGSDLVTQLREAGYDVSQAPKAAREGVKVNPSTAAHPAYTLAGIEAGKRRPKTEAQDLQGRTFTALKAAAKRGDAPAAEDLAAKLKAEPSAVAAALDRLASLGLAHPVSFGLFGAGWAPGAVQPGLAFNPAPKPPTKRALDLAAFRSAGYHDDAKAFTRALIERRVSRAEADKAWAAGVAMKAQGVGCGCYECKRAAEKVGHEWDNSATRENGTRQPVPMAKRTTKTTKAKATKAPAKARAKKATAPKVPKAAPQPKKAHQAAPAPQPAAKAPKPAAKASGLKVTKVQVTAMAVNPSSAAALAEAWEKWTGSKAGQVLRVKVSKAAVETPAGTAVIPADVVFLGRVSKLITKKGEVKDFGRSGPYLVTSAAMKSLWLLSPKGFVFDLKGVSLIAYLAKKPKFGDRDAVEYVHAFEGPTRAAMEGQVGLITGTFRLTPRGIEG